VTFPSAFNFEVLVWQEPSALFSMQFFEAFVAQLLQTTKSIISLPIRLFRGYLLIRWSSISVSSLESCSCPSRTLH